MFWLDVFVASRQEVRTKELDCSWLLCKMFCFDDKLKPVSASTLEERSFCKSMPLFSFLMQQSPSCCVLSTGMRSGLPPSTCLRTSKTEIQLDLKMEMKCHWSHYFNIL